MRWLDIKMIKRIKKMTTSSRMTISRCKMIVSWAPLSASIAGRTTTWTRRNPLNLLAAERLCAGRASPSLIEEGYSTSGAPTADKLLLDLISTVATLMRICAVR